MPGEDADSNTNTPTHSEGAGPELLMDKEENCSLKVEEEGIAWKTPPPRGTWVPASSCKTLGSAPLPHRWMLGHHHHHYPLLGLLARSAHQSSTQGHQPPQTMTQKTTTHPEAFRAETLGAEDESALGRARLDGRLVKEGEEWDTNEARACAMMLMGDAPRVESRPIPHNVLHTRAHSHTPGRPRCTG